MNATQQHIVNGEEDISKTVLPKKQVIKASQQEASQPRKQTDPVIHTVVRSDTSILGRRFTNPGSVRCWMNAALQLLLCGLDHMSPDIWNTLTSSLGSLLKSYRDPDEYTNTNFAMIMAEMPDNRWNDPEVFFEKISDSECRDIKEIFMHKTWLLNTMTECSHTSGTMSENFTFRHLLPPPNTDMNNYLEMASSTRDYALNDYYCEICVEAGKGQNRGATQNSSLLNHSSDFIIYKFFITRQTFIPGDRTINPQRIVHLKNHDGQTGMYEIIAVILFVNENHYIAHTKQTSGIWCRCDDQNISEISPSMVGNHPNGYPTHILVRRCTEQ